MFEPHQQQTSVDFMVSICTNSLWNFFPVCSKSFSCNTNSTLFQVTAIQQNFLVRLQSHEFALNSV